jgi:hypothetical protein
MVFEREGAAVRVAEYDKPNGAVIARSIFAIGQEQGATGASTTPLLSDGVDAGSIGQTNPDMLETPGAAYTPRVTEVRLGRRAVSCRWLPRTRLMGFTGRRSFVVHEDADGDLIYTTFDFAAASSQPLVELTDNSVSTTFSVEVRGGEEMVRPDGAEFRFNASTGFAYLITLDDDGPGALAVFRDGAEVQSEPLIAVQHGEGAIQ